MHRDHSSSSNESADTSRRRWVAVARPIGAVIALALLAGALFTVWQQRDTVSQALEAVRHPDPRWLSLLLGCVLANIVLSGIMFYLLMSRYGRVHWLEMQAIVSATLLVNYLPLRPGLAGRVAFHKAVHDIRARDTLKVVVQAASMTAIIAVYLAIVVVIVSRAPVPLWLGVALPVPAFLAGLATPWRLWCAAGVVRYVEVLVWVGRYVAAFALIDSPIGVTPAIALACISMIAGMVPLVSNGLGLREWSVGLLAPLLTAYHLRLALTAELVNRAAEIAMVALVGGASILWLTHKHGRRAARRRRQALRAANVDDHNPAL